jgi:hypothetical protein
MFDKIKREIRRAHSLSPVGILRDVVTEVKDVTKFAVDPVIDTTKDVAKETGKAAKWILTGND